MIPLRKACKYLPNIKTSLLFFYKRREPFCYGAMSLFALRFVLGVSLADSVFQETSLPGRPASCLVAVGGTAGDAGRKEKLKAGLVLPVSLCVRQLLYHRLCFLSDVNPPTSGSPVPTGQSQGLGSVHINPCLCFPHLRDRSGFLLTPSCLHQPLFAWMTTTY